MRKWSAILPLAVFLVLVFFLWRGLHEDPHLVPSALIGKPVPAFTASSLTDPQQRLDHNLFKGHVSLLNVWASWCLTCQAEHGMLLKIAKSGQVALDGLSYKDDRMQALLWLRRNGDPFQVVIDDPDGGLAINLGVYGTPETFLIDRKGIIRDRLVGGISPEIWQTQLLPEIERLKTED